MAPSLIIHRKIRGLVTSERVKEALTGHEVMDEKWYLLEDNLYDKLHGILTAGS